MSENFSWDDIYSYYHKKGLTMYILECLSQFVMSLIITFSPIFLFGCLNWSQITKAHSIGDVILPFWEGWLKANLFFKLSFILYSIHTLIIFIQFLSTLPKFISLKRYYSNKLSISDSDLCVIEWTEVVDSINVSDPLRSISLLTIAQDVTRQSNYICAMVDDVSVFSWRLPWKKELEQMPMDNLFFFCLIYALQGTVFENREPQVCGIQNIQANQKQESLSKKFKAIGFILVLISPFAFLYEILYTIFHFIEPIRSSTGDLSMRRLTKVAKLKARDYNELPHLFELRLGKSYEWANLFLDSFTQSPLVPLMRMLSFIAGSLIAIIFFCGLISDVPHVLGLEIVNGKTVAWLLAILASIYAACRPSAPPSNMYGYGPEDLIKELEKEIHLDFRDDQNSGHSWATYYSVNNAYAPVWKHAIMNILGVILDPFLFLVVLPNKSSTIVDFIRRNSVESQELGWICALSTTADPRYNASPEHRERQRRSIVHFEEMSQHTNQNDPGFEREDSADLMRSIFAPQQSIDQQNQPEITPNNGENSLEPTLIDTLAMPIQSQPGSSSTLSSSQIIQPQTPQNQNINNDIIDDENLLGFGDTSLSAAQFFVPDD